MSKAQHVNLRRSAARTVPAAHTPPDCGAATCLLIAAGLVLREAAIELSRNDGQAALVPLHGADMRIGTRDNKQPLLRLARMMSRPQRVVLQRSRRMSARARAGALVKARCEPQWVHAHARARQWEPSRPDAGTRGPTRGYGTRGPGQSQRKPRRTAGTTASRGPSDAHLPAGRPGDIQATCPALMWRSHSPSSCA